MQAGAGSSPTRIPQREHEECLNKLAALERAIDLAEAARCRSCSSTTTTASRTTSRTCSRSWAPRSSCGETTRSTRTTPSGSHPRTSSSPPGPGGPRARAQPLDIVQRLAPTMPTLGVCLGHQAIVEAFGGEIGQAKRLVHGKATDVEHDGRGIFDGLPDAFEAGRYHSLAATVCPTSSRCRATTDDGEVMAVRHRAARRRNPVPPRIGAHARSGRDLLRNFLEGRGDPAGARTADGRARPDATDDARDGDGPDHGRRGDAGADRRVPRRAADQG